MIPIYFQSKLITPCLDVSYYLYYHLKQAILENKEQQVQDVIHLFKPGSQPIDEPTLLQLAIKKGNGKIVELLIKNGADVNSVNENKETVLMQAIIGDHTEIAVLLIEESATLDIQNNTDDTALHLACNKNNLKIAKLLIDRKASLNIIDNNGDTALNIAIFREGIEIATVLIENGARFDIKNKLGDSAFCTAVGKNNSKIVEILIENGADVNSTDEDDDTVLMQAILRGHVEMAALLIEKGAQLDIQNSDGQTALHLACNEGNIEIVKLLIDKKAPLDVVDNEGNSALITAISVRSFDIGKLMISKRRTEIAKLLIENGARIDIKNDDGISPLLLAVQEQKIEIVKLLIEKGVELDNVDERGSSSLSFATQYYDKQILKLLCQSGAKITRELLKGLFEDFAELEHPLCAIELLRYVKDDVIDNGIILAAINAAIQDTIDEEDVTKCCIYEMLIAKAQHITLYMEDLHAAVQRGLSERAVRALLTKVSLQDRIEFALLYRQDDPELPRLINNTSLEIAENIVDLAIKHKYRNLKFYYDLFTKHEKLMITKAQFSAIGKLIVKQSESEQLFLAKTMKLLYARSTHMPLSETDSVILENLKEQQMVYAVKKEKKRFVMKTLKDELDNLK